MRIATVFHVTCGWLALVASPLCGQGFTPEEAVSRMKVPPEFEVRVVASEPLVRQPVCIEFDDRGRLWVIQYLQYPNPEGLNRIQVDRYSRTKYDRIPEPPPKGPKGADRITILSDTDGDGRMDDAKDFVQGLNLATGLAFGHGGVYVLNVPYLLFYPDRDRNDVPDSDPEVLLTGFGMEDAHSVANSLTWGPDGWLYGCQGSTVTANINGIEFQQGVWRYHPKTRAFELFCEGGGNCWGLDFDRTGELLYSTNYGGHVMLHGVQGSYLVKSFAKHGALHNPHAYGYFEHTPHQNFYGGHVTVGGIVYQGDTFPAKFRNKYIAGDLLGHGVYWHQITPRGSTFQTAHGGELITANDTWFAPTDVTMGPDGAVYVSDWYDARTAHPDPDANWDRSNGRIYRLAAKNTPVPAAMDFARVSNDELLKLLRHSSQWFVRRARMELSQRRVGKESLLPGTRSENENEALESLWSLNAIGEFNESLADELLNSPHPSVRMWAVRLLGDSKTITPEMAHRLDKFAEKDPALSVRRQLASTAARLPAHQALPIINANINRDIDADDPYIPLLWWWAVEKHSVSGREEVMKRFVRPSLWKSRLGSKILLTRLIRRYASERTAQGLDCVIQLLKAAPDDTARDTLWQPILQGWRESSAPKVQDEGYENRSGDLAQIVHARWKQKPDDSTLLELLIDFGNRETLDYALRESLNTQRSPADRVQFLNHLAEVPETSLIDQMLPLAQAEGNESVRLAAIRLLGRFDDPRVASLLVELNRASKLDAIKTTSREILFGRKSFAAAWLAAIDKGEISPLSTPIDQVQRLAVFGDPEIDALVQKHWGRLGTSRGEKLAEVRRLSNDLRAAQGNIHVGKEVFRKNCSTCHQLFGEGTKVGPDLTTSNRKDRDFMLLSLVDPSIVIRKEFASFTVQTTDGRLLTGMAVTNDNDGITLVNAKNERTTIPSNQIEELRESDISLMPEDLYRRLSPGELRDLFAYLESNQDAQSPK